MKEFLLNLESIDKIGIYRFDTDGFSVGNIIKIWDNYLLLKSYDTENNEFVRDSEKYTCLIHDGLLTLSGDQPKGELPEYVSPNSSWYSGYEKGQVKITN